MKTDLIKEFRVAFLDLSVVCAVILLTGLQPTWSLVWVFVALYFACLVLGAVVAVVREERAQR